MDSSFAAEIIETETADQFVRNEQRVRINQNASNFIKSKGEAFELVLDGLIRLGPKVSPSKPDDFREIVPQQTRQVGFHRCASGNNRLAQQIAQGATLDRRRRNFRQFPDQSQEYSIGDDEYGFILLRVCKLSQRTEQVLLGGEGIMF